MKLGNNAMITDLKDQLINELEHIDAAIEADDLHLFKHHLREASKLCNELHAIIPAHQLMQDKNDA